MDDNEIQDEFDKKCGEFTDEICKLLEGSSICSFIISYLGDISDTHKGCTVIHAYEPLFKEKMKRIQDNVNANTATFEESSKLANFYYDTFNQIDTTKDSLINLYKSLSLAARELGEKMGANRARIIPIKKDTTYKLFTLKSVYELSYDDEFIFSLTRLNPDGSRGETKKYFFMGCAQEDGEIFGYESMPLISTGDRILFSSLQDKTLPEYVTSSVLDVIEEGTQN